MAVREIACCAPCSNSAVDGALCASPLTLKCFCASCAFPWPTSLPYPTNVVRFGYAHRFFPPGITPTWDSRISRHRSNWRRRSKTKTNNLGSAEQKRSDKMKSQIQQPLLRLSARAPKAPATQIQLSAQTLDPWQTVENFQLVGRLNSSGSSLGTDATGAHAFRSAPGTGSRRREAADWEQGTRSQKSAVKEPWGESASLRRRRRAAGDSWIARRRSSSVRPCCWSRRPLCAPKATDPESRA